MGIFDIFKKKEELTDEEKLYKEYPILKALNSGQKRRLLRKINRKMGIKK